MLAVFDRILGFLQKTYYSLLALNIYLHKILNKEVQIGEIIIFCFRERVDGMLACNLLGFFFKSSFHIILQISYQVLYSYNDFICMEEFL